MTQINIKLKESQAIVKGDIIINLGTVLQVSKTFDLIILQVDQTFLEIKPPKRTITLPHFLKLTLYSTNQE